MVQVPGATVVAVERATVHTAAVSEVNDTGSSEVADADRVTESFTLAGAGWSKVIVCPAFTVNERCTSKIGRASCREGGEAVMVEVPGVMVVAVERATVETWAVSGVTESG